MLILATACELPEPVRIDALNLLAYRVRDELRIRAVGSSRMRFSTHCTAYK